LGDGEVKILRRLALAGVGSVVAAMLPLVTAVPAHAEGYMWLMPEYEFTYGGQTQDVWGLALEHSYACGLKACNTVGSLAGGAYRVSGTYASNLVKYKSAIDYTGMGVSASLSAAGVSLTFSDYNTGCSHDWWDGGKYSVSVNFGSADICHASSWGTLTSVRLTATGAFRFGDHWEIRPVSNVWKIG
jgi:hypothetical protein